MPDDRDSRKPPPHDLLSGPVQESDEPIPLVIERSRRRAPRASFGVKVVGWWQKIPGIWKALGLIVAIFSAGVGTATYVQTEIRQYVLRHDFEQASAANEARWTAIETQVQSLQLVQAQRDAQVDAIKVDTASMREDVRQLLNFILAHPPAKKRAQ